MLLRRRSWSNYSRCDIVDEDRRIDDTRIGLSPYARESSITNRSKK